MDRIDLRHNNNYMRRMILLWNKKALTLESPKDNAFECGNARKGFWRIAEYFMNHRIPNGTKGGVRVGD